MNEKEIPKPYARVSPFHEWLVRKYVALSTKIPRVGGWIIGLHHDPTLENPAAGIWLAVAWEKTRYPLRSGYLVFSHCSTVLQGVSAIFSLQHCSAAGI